MSLCEFMISSLMNYYESYDKIVKKFITLDLVVYKSIVTNKYIV